MKTVVIGGGAGGFFSAIAAASSSKVIILERSAKLLSKVKISGGGRCNVTHACFDPKLLVQNYPRGSKELLGPFHQFQPADTMQWFEERGIELKTESDGRMFPITDSSQTIIDCLVGEARKLGVEIRTLCKVETVKKVDGRFHIMPEVVADRLILASGSSPIGYKIAQEFGHTIVPPVPSLFTFNIPDFSLKALAGVSTQARVSIEGSGFKQTGPLLITHWGFSGPAALKLSAFSARELAERDYSVDLLVDWLPEMSTEEIAERFEAGGKKLLANMAFLPKSLWRALCGELAERPVAAMGKKNLSSFVQKLKGDRYRVSGKTTNKEEFVTCGGVKLSEVNFKTMESRLCKGLFFCGEVLDIDGVTGGFNFQSAWTTGWIAGSSVNL